MVSSTDARLLTAAVAGVLAIAFAAPVQAAPLPQDPGCVTPDGAPCPAPPPGCVQDNGMPCTASLPDLNAACARNRGRPRRRVWRIGITPLNKTRTCRERHARS